MAVYLDHNATTPIKPVVADLLHDVVREGGNPSSQHSAGRAARKHVEDARAQVANLVQYRAQNVIFTSGATEANNMIMQGHEGPVLISAIEHPSVLNVRSDAVHIPVDSNGIVRLDAVEELLKTHSPKLVSVMAVNNETGVIQPVAEIGRLCKKHGMLFHCDAVQAAGKIDIDFEAWGCDFMSLSAHKMGGTVGSGALVFRSSTPVPKLLKGGGQERRQRAGTENVPGIAAMGLAAELALQDKDAYQALETWRDRIETALAKNDKVTLHIQNAPRIANTTSFSVAGGNAQTLLMQFDLNGVCVSSGSACSSGSVQPSHVLQAMGVPADLATSSIRVSLGWNSTEKDVDAFLAAWQKMSAS